MIAINRYFKLSELNGSLRRHVDENMSVRRVFMVPSHSNDEAILESLRREGSYFGAKPEIWGWSEMYRALVPRSAQRRQIDPPDHRLILRYVMDNTLGELDGRGISVPKAARRNGFIDILSSAIRELLLEGVAPDRLAFGTASGTSAITPRELLYRLYTDYLIYLDERELADNSQIPSLTLKDMQLPGPGDSKAFDEICWVGFMSFTGAQLKLIKTLRFCDFDMSFWSPDPCLENFRDAALQLGDDTPPGGGTKCFVSLMTSRDIYSQYDDAARAIADIRAGRFEPHQPAGHEFDADDIGVMTAPGMIDLMASALAKYGVPHQVRSEVAVGDTAIIEIVRAVWSAYKLGWPTGRTASLFSSPLFGLCAFNEKKLFSRMPEGVAAWRAFLSDSEKSLALFERLNSFCVFLDDPKGHTAEELLGALLNLFSESWILNVSGEAWGDCALDDAVRTVASARLEIEEKLDLLAELTPPLGEAGAVRFSGASAVEFIVDWSSNASTALPPRLSGVVALYDSPPPVLVSHSLWVMTDVDPGRFPGAMSDHTLLDGETRANVNALDEELVHLPTLHEKRCQQEALFRRLLCVGESLTLATRSALDSQGRPQESSPFLESALSDRTARWEKLCEKKCKSPISFGIRSYRGRFPRAAASAAAGKRRVRASSVDEWYECPYSFWLSKVVGLEPPLDGTELPDRMAQGNVVHSIWDDVWRMRMSSGRTLHSILSEGWADLLSARSADFPFLFDPRATATMDRVRADMLAMAALQDDVETRAESEGLVRLDAVSEASLPLLEMDSVIFTARADRLDVWEGIGAVIVDYKLGRSDGYRNSLQLAVYAAMIRAAGAMDVAGYCYLCHADGRVRGSWANGVLKKIYGGYGNDPAGLDGNVDNALGVMRDMDFIVGGGLYAANYDSKMCRRCAYSLICRRAERMGAYAPEEEEANDDTD